MKFCIKTSGSLNFMLCSGREEKAESLKNMYVSNQQENLYAAKFQKKTDCRLWHGKFLGVYNF